MATTIYHPIGTCKIGADGDELAVVDSALRVRGVQGLRVIDASVMPLIPNVNTDLPTRMVGYHAAEMMVEEWPQPPARSPPMTDGYFWGGFDGSESDERTEL